MEPNVGQSLDEFLYSVVHITQARLQGVAQRPDVSKQAVDPVGVVRKNFPPVLPFGNVVRRQSSGGAKRVNQKAGNEVPISRNGTTN